MSKYREEVWQELCRVKSLLVDNCKECCSGYIYNDGYVSTCRCMVVFKYISKLIIAEIPTEYWSLAVNTLQVDASYKKMLKYYFKWMKSAVSRSLGFLFMGVNGVGKTTMMCEIGKQFIVNGYTVKYFTVEQYVSALRPNATRSAEEFNTADVLLVDELGKAYVKEGSSFVMDTLEQFIRSAVTKKVVIMSTNFDQAALQDFLGDSTVSVLQRHLKFVQVAGSDFSEHLQEDWKNRLEEEMDYFHKNIVKMAYLKEEHEREKAD